MSTTIRKHGYAWMLALLLLGTVLTGCGSQEEWAKSSNMARHRKSLSAPRNPARARLYQRRIQLNHW